MTELELKKKYKCTLGLGGWCDGTKVGSRMRCPKHGLTPSRDRICLVGFERGLDEMMNQDVGCYLCNGVSQQDQDMNYMCETCKEEAKND